MGTVIYKTQDNKIVIEYEKTCSKDFLKIIEETSWGTKDTLYTMHNLEDELNSLGEVYYVTLKDCGIPSAVCALNKKRVSIDGECDASYLFLVSVVKSKQGKGLGTRLVSKVAEYFLARLNGRGIIYAYVEEDNIHSEKMFGKNSFIKLGGFEVPIFSRLNPRKNDDVIKLINGDREKVLDILKNQYGTHVLTDFNQSLEYENYYIYREKDEILAGAQIKKFTWTFTNLPGISGRIMLSVLPHMPIINKVFDPKNYTFLKLGNIYVKEGYEAKLTALIQALLFKHKLHMAMVYIDPGAKRTV